jgi:cytidylate kinase
MKESERLQKLSKELADFRLAVSGYPGSGTTTLCRWLAEFLGFRYYYTGQVMRDLAKAKNQSIEVFFEELAKKPGIEIQLDERQAKILREERFVIAEGRMAPFMAPEVRKIKLLLVVHPQVGAHRQMLRAENQGLSFSRVFRKSQKRIETERERYRSLYGIPNHFDPFCFDIVIDTTNLTIDGMCEKAARRICEFLSENWLHYIKR